MNAKTQRGTLNNSNSMGDFHCN